MEQGDLFTDLSELQAAYLDGHITPEIFLNEYVRLKEESKKEREENDQ